MSALADFRHALALDPSYASTAGDVERVAKLAAGRRPQQGYPLPKADENAVRAACAHQKRIALVIGNANYPPPSRLDNPGHDADDVKTLLEEKLCFKVIFAHDANFDQFTRKISEFADAAQGADVALFYFAGHGMQLNGVNLLLPIDSQLQNEFEAMRRNVSAQDVVSLIEARARTTLVFLDACRTNPLENDFRQRMTQAGRAMGETRGLAPMTASSETLVVFATRPNAPAADGKAQHNSPFASAFLQYIAEPDKDIELVMRDVSNAVRSATDGKQTPQRLTELNRGLVLAPSH